MISISTNKKWLLAPLTMALLLLVPPLSIGSGLEDFRSALSDNYRTEFNGFVEVRGGARLHDDPQQKNISVGEFRVQLDLSSDLDWAIFKVKTDLLGDLVTEEAEADLRELNLAFSPLEMMDVKFGRQVLTWGTGDLLFINDLFPKDWESFFIGRDDEYLKAPSDALKTSFFLDSFDLDLVYVPEFNGSVYIDGSRLSYWNGFAGGTVGQDFIFVDEERNRVFRDDEFHLRVARNFNGFELGVYGYHGFWKTPEGVIMTGPTLYYPGLAVGGASLRTTMLGGIGNVEIGYYDSFEDRDGSDPLVRNSELRLLAGFERELGRDLTGAFQYYLEYMQDYGEYEQGADPATKKDEVRHLLTARLTRLLMEQNLRLSLFVYYSPSDEDGYLRPKFNYKVNDQLAIDGGINWFFGSADHTFFGQFEDASNVYAGIRWNF